jgi:hypothetical protein
VGEKHGHCLDVPELDGEHERRAAGELLRLELRATRQEQLGGLGLAVARGDVQRGHGVA